MIGLVIHWFLLALSVYSYLLFGYAIMSWIPGLSESPLGRFVQFLVEPILKPLYRFNLQFAGLDFTVWAAMILLNLLGRFVVLLLS